MDRIISNLFTRILPLHRNDPQGFVLLGPKPHISTTHVTMCTRKSLAEVYVAWTVVYIWCKASIKPEPQIFLLCSCTEEQGMEWQRTPSYHQRPLNLSKSQTTEGRQGKSPLSHLQGCFHDSTGPLGHGDCEQTQREAKAIFPKLECLFCNTTSGKQRITEEN